MNILTIGDLVGDIGVKKLKKELSRHWNSAWGDVGVNKHYS